MNAEYKEHLFLSEMRAKGLIEDTKSKAEEKATFERIATLFKFWLIESKKCTEESFHDALNEDNFRDWKDSQWRVKNLPIVIELIGTNDLNSQVIKIGHIKKVLSAHKLTPSEAIDLLEDIGKEAHSPSFYKKVISEIVKHLEQLISRPSERNIADKVDDKSNPKVLTNPFKVGLLFASGEIYKLCDEYKNNASAIARALDNESYRPYITQTLSHNEKKYGSKDDKNIFLRLGLMSEIINHCKENGIAIHERFMTNYNTLQSKS
jgi:hypothetical protein